MPELELDKSRDDMTNRELRAKIAQRVGCRPNNQLSKTTLNSLHAWFTGGFHTDRQLIKPGHPPKMDIMKAVVREAIQVYDSHPLDPDDGDLDDHPVPDLVVYRRELLDMDDGEQPPTMWKAQLTQLLNAMDSRGDQRTWMPSNRGGDT